MQKKQGFSLILASGSPRRKELLSWLNIPFEIVQTDIEEKSTQRTPRLIAEEIARNKGLAAYEVVKKHPSIGESYFPFLVAADTIVVLGDKILGKPKDIIHARSMLTELAGKSHKVITSVHLGMTSTIEKRYKELIFSTETEVKFENITRDMMDLYLESGESLDKAGAYGIQGQSLMFVSHLEGSYSNVVGLPLAELVLKIKEFLNMKTDNDGNWRSLFRKDI